MTHAQSGKFLGVHRTAILADGTGKLAFADGTSSKLMLGTASGAVVKLSPFENVLGIAEGIETALSAKILFNIPVWSTLNAGGMASLPVIPGVDFLSIFADSDSAGREAALCCAQRYAAWGVKGQIHYPPVPFNDWNDYRLHESNGE